MSRKIIIIGAGINGLVAANYLQRNGYQVSIIESKAKVGGACTSETVTLAGKDYRYASGASVLGLMQRFIFEETGLSKKLKTFVPESPKLVFFPNDSEPTIIYRNPKDLDRELRDKWGEQGNIEAFREDESRVIDFLQTGYRDAVTPNLEDARSILGEALTNLWITGDAKTLLDHYFTSDKAKIYMAMTVAESGPVSIREKSSALTIPIMDSGSIFSGYYGFVYEGIWQVTEELEKINRALGVNFYTSSKVLNVDTKTKSVNFISPTGEEKKIFDQLIFATDPLTASQLVNNSEHIEKVSDKKLLGSSGKLNLLFKQPIQWKHNIDHPDSDASFRFIFSVETLEEFEQATLSVCDQGVDYVPGFMQIYCEGAASKKMNKNLNHDRIAVFFKNLSLDKRGEDLSIVSEEIQDNLFENILNPEDCIWTNLVTPKNLQETFYFPQGNIDHIALTDKQMYFDRTFSFDPENNFYGFFNYEDIFYCGAGSYPCGSIAGTPGYMCSQQLIRLDQ